MNTKPKSPIKVISDAAVRNFLATTMEIHKQSVAESAKSLEMDRPNLYRLLRRHGLRPQPVAATVGEDG